MKKRWYVILWLGVDVALLIAIARVLALDRVQMIIKFGVKATDSLIMTKWITWIAMALIANTLLLIGYRKLKKKQQVLKVKFNLSPEVKHDPEKVRQEILSFQRMRPKLNDLLERGIDQLDNIARKQDRMTEILERNQVKIFSLAQDSLKTAEQAICKKLLLVLNRALLCDPEEENLERKRRVYEENCQQMTAFLHENEDILNQCEVLLTKVVIYVEEQKVGTPPKDVEEAIKIVHLKSFGGIHLEQQ